MGGNSRGGVMKRRAISRAQTLLGLLYVAAGSAKLLGAGLMVDAFAAIGLGDGIRLAVGAVEIVGGLCLFVPQVAALAGFVLVGSVVAVVGMTVGHMAGAGYLTRAPDGDMTVVRT